MFYTYAIINESDKLYIGQTSDLEKRLGRHNGLLKNKAKSFTNKNRGKWKLLYKEEFKTRSEAIFREKQLKSYKGRKFLRTLIKTG